MSVAKLFYSAGSCSLAVHIALIQLKIDYQLVPIRLYQKEAIFEVNPKGNVPTLIIEGETWTETALILQYLSDRYPEKTFLSPYGTTERYRENEWLNYIATELHKSFSLLFKLDRLSLDKTPFLADLEKKLLYLEQTYPFKENSFNAVDAYLFTILRFAAFTGPKLDGYKNLQRFLTVTLQENAVQKAIKVEKLK